MTRSLYRRSNTLPFPLHNKREDGETAVPLENRAVRLETWAVFTISQAAQEGGTLRSFFDIMILYQFLCALPIHSRTVQLSHLGQKIPAIHFANISGSIKQFARNDDGP